MDFGGRRGTSVGGGPDGVPGRNHSSSLLRDGSLGGDHSSPSSLTAFVMTADELLICSESGIA